MLARIIFSFAIVAVFLTSFTLATNASEDNNRVDVQPTTVEFQWDHIGNPHIAAAFPTLSFIDDMFPLTREMIEELFQEEHIGSYGDFGFSR